MKMFVFRFRHVHTRCDFWFFSAQQSSENTSKRKLGNQVSISVVWFFWLLCHIPSLVPPTKEEVNAFARVRLSVCLYVYLLARSLKNACMDLDEMLRVDRCRDMDEMINFWALNLIVRIQEPHLHRIFLILAGYFNLRNLDKILWVFRFWAKSGS